MTRYCRSQEILSKWNFNPLLGAPPPYEDFDRENDLSVCKTSKKDYPKIYPTEVSDMSEPEEDDSYEFGNLFWKEVKENYKTDLKNKIHNLENLRAKDFRDCNVSDETEIAVKRIFPSLMPGLVKCLDKANERNLLRKGPFGFDSIDFLTEYVYKNNPQNPVDDKDLYEYEKFRKLAEENPRQDIPKSWSWGREEAAVVIQRNVRGWLARKKPELQRLRKFWDALYNPLTARENLTPSLLGEEASPRLKEIYSELSLPFLKRKMMSYEAVFKNKMSVWEERQHKKAIEEKIKAYLSKREKK